MALENPAFTLPEKEEIPETAPEEEAVIIDFQQARESRQGKPALDAEGLMRDAETMKIIEKLKSADEQKKWEEMRRIEKELEGESRIPAKTGDVIEISPITEQQLEEEKQAISKTLMDTYKIDPKQGSRTIRGFFLKLLSGEARSLLGRYRELDDTIKWRKRRTGAMKLALTGRTEEEEKLSEEELRKRDKEREERAKELRKMGL